MQILLPQQPSQLLTTKKTSSDDSEKGKITEKDLFTLLKDVDGLPNEMLSLVSDILRMYTGLDSTSIDTAGLSSLYALNIYKLKRANFNKNEYDKAYKLAESNQGLNEFAISASGKMVVYDKDKELTQVSVSDFLKHLEDYQAVTNSNLLYLRAHDPSFVNNNQIFDVVNNAIGINKVEELIRARFSSLGTDEIRQEGYATGMSNDVIKGFEVLLQAQQAGLSVALLAKQKSITKTQERQASAALSYIYQTLPDNAKAILLLRSGNTDNPLKGAIDIISNMIQSKMDNYLEQSIDIQGNMNTDGSNKSTSKGSKLEDEDINIAQQFLRGYGLQEQFVLNPGTNLATAVASNMMPLVAKDGTNLGVNCTLLEASKGQYGTILDWNNVTMGGRKIDSSYFNQVLVEDGMIRSVDFPVDENGNPDLRPTTLQTKKEVDAQLAALGIDMSNPLSIAENYDTINKLYQDAGFNTVYDAQGNIVGGNWRRFAVMQGIADNRALNMDPIGDSSYLLNEITDENRIDNLISTILDKTKIEKLDFDKNDSWLFEGDYDMLMEGTIWIPLNVNDWNAAAGSGSTISRKLGIEMENQQIIRDQRDRLIHQYNKPEQP